MESKVANQTADKDKPGRNKVIDNLSGLSSQCLTLKTAMD